MIRKLISMGLCSVGVLALLGAGELRTEETSNHTENNTKEDAVFVTASKGTDLSQMRTVSSEGDGDSEEGEQSSLVEEFAFSEEGDIEEFEHIMISGLQEDSNEEPVEESLPETATIAALQGGDDGLYVNGFPVSSDTNRYIKDGVTYVSMMAMAKALDSSALCTWDESKGKVTIVTNHMTVEATAGQLYIIANGRYLYVQETLQRGESDLVLPLSVMVKAFAASMYWDFDEGHASVITGSGYLEAGDTFYDANDLFWLSRVIFAESGNEPVEGQMGVAMVVNNRVAHSEYPNTILGVLSQKNQFSTYKNGALASRTPNASSVIAAKLVMDGGIVTELKYATHFDSLAGSWADRNLRTIQVIGGHTFYA